MDHLGQARLRFVRSLERTTDDTDSTDKVQAGRSGTSRSPDSRGRNAQLPVNHLFIRFIRVIRGLIVFGRKRLNDFFETWIAAERVPEGQQF